MTYVATARVDPTDAEWVARLALHAASRPASWKLIETARNGAPTLAELARAATADQTLIVESLGTWLADRMAALFDAGGGPEVDARALEDEMALALDALVGSAAHVIVVGEETGWGLVPTHASGRLFRDVLGRAQQRLAREARAAYLVVAGFALDLHALATPVE